MKKFVFFLFVLAMLIFSAVPVPAGNHPVIELKNIKFIPQEVSIVVGEKVTWEHKDGQTPHSVTAHDGSSFDYPETCTPAGVGCWVQGNPPTFSHTFSDEGTFTYFCKVHPSMTGKITVTAKPNPPPSPSPPPKASPSPAKAAPPPSPSPSPSPTPSAEPSDEPSPTATNDASPSPAITAMAGEESGGLSGGIIAAIIGVVVAAAAGGGLWWMRRTSG